MNMLGLTLLSTGLLALAGCIAPEPGFYGGGRAYFGDSPRYYGAPDGDRRGEDRGRNEGHDR